MLSYFNAYNIHCIFSHFFSVLKQKFIFLQYFFINLHYFLRSINISIFNSFSFINSTQYIQRKFNSWRVNVISYRTFTVTIILLTKWSCLHAKNETLTVYHKICDVSIFKVEFMSS